MKQVELTHNYGFFLTFNKWLDDTNTKLITNKEALEKLCKAEYKKSHKGKYNAKGYTAFLKKQNITEYLAYGNTIGYVFN